jgi:Xaa-Pro aminopeptidase
MNRIERLAAALREEGISAYLAQTPVSMGYLHGFWEDAHERFMSLGVAADGRVKLICPALSETQARKVGIQDIDVWSDGEDPLSHFRKLAAEWNLGGAAIAVDAEMPARMLLSLQSELPDAKFLNGAAILGQLRRVKEEAELTRMREAAAIADQAFDEVLPQIRIGQTEREVSKLLSDAMERRGGKTSFSIVAVGANSAEPHHLNDDTPVALGEVLLMDFGCEWHGYQSDITRTVFVGKAPADVQEIYGLVYAAHQAGRAAIWPGATGAEIDAAARRVIGHAGYGAYFFHRLGHGIGLQGHEAPDMASYNHEPVEPGNCFSIEPGIYLAGRFGVRIENIVAVTADGYRSLNDEPADQIIEILVG